MLYPPHVTSYAPSAAGVSGLVEPEPTDARPGSEAKLQVLCERARLNQSLWHADDPYREMPRSAEGIHLGPQINVPLELLLEMDREAG